MLDSETQDKLSKGVTLHNVFHEDKPTICQIVWSPDGKIVTSGSMDKTIRLWDVTTGDLKQTLTGHSGYIISIAWSPDGRMLASGSSDRTIRLWDVTTGLLYHTFREVSAEEIYKRQTPEKPTSLSPMSSFRAIQLLNELIIANSQSQPIYRRMWNIEAEPLFLYQQPDISSGVALISQKEPSFVSDGFGTPSRYKPARLHLQPIRQPYVIQESYSGPVYRLAWSPDGQMLAWGNSKESILLLNMETNQLYQEFKSDNGQILSLAWSSDGKFLASGYYNPVLQVWSVETGKLLHTFEGHFNPVSGVVWLPNSQKLASCSHDKTIRVWDCETGRQTDIIEGHTDKITNIACSMDGCLLASKSRDGTVRIWRTDNWEAVEIIQEPTSSYNSYGVAFHPKDNRLATLGEKDRSIRIWDMDIKKLLGITPSVESVHHINAKIVLVGESNVGKSCLALRLAENRYEEQGTTHGMRFWHLSPKQLNPDSVIPEGEQRNIILWDMGGQHEYRLVHQLFLHDSTLALILFDPTRGEVAFKEVESWNKQLEGQLIDRQYARQPVKLLIGTKLDGESTIVDQTRLNRLIKNCGFADYYPTSAKTGKGIPEFCAAISQLLNWETLTKISRPKLFQRIQYEIERQLHNGRSAFSYSELERRIYEEEPDQFDPKAVNEVVMQLAIQGVLVDTSLASGERELVLQVSEVERYAGSIIIAARNNLRNIPAIEKQMIASPNMSFPGISDKERLYRDEERIVLGGVVQLLLEHGICLEHEGLLIFPSLFRPTERTKPETIPHVVSLYYDFSGAIDNIYASLIAKLAIGEEFGRMRLWEDRAEFEWAGYGACGLRKVERGSGYAHLDIYFEENTPDDTRKLFISFIEAHLSQHGVEIYEHIEIICTCGFRFSEDSIKTRIAKGYSDIGCPDCDCRIKISEGAKKARKHDTALTGRTWGLKTMTEQRTQEIIKEVKDVIEQPDVTKNLTESLWVLHLSDLHIVSDTGVKSILQPLIADLTDSEEGLGLKQLDYLVISGDLSNRATPIEFEKVYQFISALIEQFNLTAERCIIVPGNHDVDWNEEVYKWKGRRPDDTKQLKEGNYVEQQRVLGTRDETWYSLRFKSFSENLYHPLMQLEYPRAFEEQCIPFLFPDSGLLFLAMNSCWEIDEYFPDRSGIYDEALSIGLMNADDQIVQAKQEGRLSDDASVLRIAVWHHPVTGNEKILNDAFLERLKQKNVKLCLHGHIHEERADLIGYLHPTRKLYVIGTGSFGAPVCARPESIPRLYNVLEIDREHKKIKVHTRCLRKDTGAWEGWGVWSGSSATEKRTYYEINLASLK